MTPASQPASLAVARIIAAAMTFGVVMVWSIAWVISQGGAAPASPAAGVSESAVLIVWGAVAASGLAAALVLQRGAASYAEAARLTGEQQPQQINTHVQTRLIIAWALLEAPALLSGVALIVLGARTVVLAAIPIFLVGMALTFPRAEWFARQSAS